MPNRIHLFNAFGVELEYMIVDKDTLNVASITDQLLTILPGVVQDEYNNGRISWSNELVMHVVELKSSEPDADLATIAAAFHQNILEINQKLAQWNAMLLPTAAHPWMNPQKEVKLWPYGQKEIYQKYDSIFNCQGHGWSNLQSTHLNLPFYDDEEFSKLHTAIRLVLPLIPALTASSPILGGKFTGYLDRRLSFYQSNQQRIPSITGKVIPERIFSKRTYQKMIFDRIAADIKPFDPEGILDPVWVNSRGAIARFDRGSIEIRIMDIQEAPVMDLAITQFVVLLLKALIYKNISTFEQQEGIATTMLSDIFKKVIEVGSEAIVEDESYLNSLGIQTKENKVFKVADILGILVNSVAEAYPKDWNAISPYLSIILNEGNLSVRMLKYLNGDFSLEKLKSLYGQLGVGLQKNEPFRVK